MRLTSAVMAALACVTSVLSDASNAAVDIRVDLATKTMHVVSSDGEAHDWAVSTARKGYVTPTGTYGVQSLRRVHFSRKYRNAPMPYSIFFRGGYAIHGTYETAALGRAASHGCIRLSPDHAATLFNMVKAQGARITIVAGSPSDSTLVARETRPHLRRTVIAKRRAPADPLAYAPAVSPGFDEWMTDPGAY